MFGPGQQSVQLALAVRASRRDQQFCQREQRTQCSIPVGVVTRVDDLHNLVKAQQEVEPFHLRKGCAYPLRLLDVEAAVEQEYTGMPAQQAFQQDNPVQQGHAFCGLFVDDMSAQGCVDLPVAAVAAPDPRACLTEHRQVRQRRRIEGTGEDKAIRARCL
jgi:hypothetical protein